MLQLLAATSNKHKIQEFQDMFRDQPESLRILSPDDVGGLPELIENGATFEENSAMKAEQASRYADISAFADDSGLVVEALNGEPGIYSARYAETNEGRIAKLLKNMEGVTNRKAMFVCVISLAYRGHLVAQFRGEVHGVIAQEARGNAGFGYDPIFIPDGYDKTFGELGSDVKDTISHRARAFAQAADFVRAELETMDDFEFI